MWDGIELNNNNQVGRADVLLLKQRYLHKIYYMYYTIIYNT